MPKFTLKTVVENLDGVPEAYRERYAKGEDGKFRLDEIEIDDAAEVRQALEKERAARKAAKADLEQYKGIDPEKAREAQARLDKLDEQQLIDKGEFDRLLKKRSDEFEARENEYKTQLEGASKQLTKFKLTDKVRAAAVAGGVRQDRIDDVLALTSGRFKLGDKDQIIVLDADGDESTATPEKFFAEEYKGARPDYYAASGAGGSGAPAGGAQGGGSGAKTMKRAEFDKLGAEEKHNFMVKEKGTLTD